MVYTNNRVISPAKLEKIVPPFELESDKIGFFISRINACIIKERIRMKKSGNIHLPPYCVLFREISIREDPEVYIDAVFRMEKAGWKVKICTCRNSRSGKFGCFKNKLICKRITLIPEEIVSNEISRFQIMDLE